MTLSAPISQAAAFQAAERVLDHLQATKAPRERVEDFETVAAFIAQTIEKFRIAAGETPLFEDLNP